MARIPKSENGMTPFMKIIGHNKEIHEKWLALEKAFFDHPTLGSDILEQVRRVTSWGQDCKY